MIDREVAVTWSEVGPLPMDVIRSVLSPHARVRAVEVGSISGLLPEDEVASRLAEFTHIIVRSGRFTASLLGALPNLKHIAVAGSGIDEHKVDLAAAARLGVSVTNAPGGNSIAVAELAMALMLMLVRDLNRLVDGVRMGKWLEMRSTGQELSGRTLALLGLGPVGQAVAKRASAFGMRLVGADPAYTADEIRAVGVEAMDFTGVLAEADILSLHVPLSDRTRHLLDAEAISSMKRGTYVINTSRGGVIDEESLEAALRSGHISGAALDVRAVEPPRVGDRLNALPNVISTPHIGASTEEALRRVAAIAAEEIARTLIGDPPRYLVRPHVAASQKRSAVTLHAEGTGSDR